MTTNAINELLKEKSKRMAIVESNTRFIDDKTKENELLYKDMATIDDAIRLLSNNSPINQVTINPMLSSVAALKINSDNEKQDNTWPYLILEVLRKYRTVLSAKQITDYLKEVPGKSHTEKLQMTVSSILSKQARKGIIMKNGKSKKDFVWGLPEYFESDGSIKDAHKPIKISNEEKSEKSMFDAS